MLGVRINQIITVTNKVQILDLSVTETYESETVAVMSELRRMVLRQIRAKTPTLRRNKENVGVIQVETATQQTDVSYRK